MQCPNCNAYMEHDDPRCPKCNWRNEPYATRAEKDQETFIIAVICAAGGAGLAAGFSGLRQGHLLFTLLSAPFAAFGAFMFVYLRGTKMIGKPSFWWSVPVCIIACIIGMMIQH